MKKPLLKDHWFWGSVIKSKKEYISVLSASVFINIFALVSAFFVMIVYDKVIPNNATETLIVLTIGIAIIVLFDLIMKITRSSFIDKAGASIDERVSSKLFNRLIRNEKLISQPSGKTATVVKDFEQIREFIGSASFTAFVDLPFLFLFLFVLYSIGGMVAAIPAIIVLSIVFIGLAIQPILRKLSFNAAIDGQSKQSALVEMLGGIETLKSLPGIEVLYKRWMGSVQKQNEVSIKSKFWSGITGSFSQSAQQVSQVGIVFYGVYLIADGSMTMGSLIACVILSGRTLAPLGQISSLLGRFNQTIASYKAFDELMQEPIKEIERTSQLRRELIDGHIKMNKVELSYPSREQKVLNGITLDIKPGERVAFVGGVGSGKTTILRVLSGVYDTTGGSVTISDSDIKHMNPDDIRKHIGVVMQDAVIFSGTLKENLLLGKIDATDEEIIRACKIAGVDQMASRMPQGYDTRFSEGGQELSGGQRQSISIARAFISNPKIMIMDEPSSAMDSASEMRLLGDLKRSLGDKTFILITHRKKLLDVVDRVITIEDGVVVADQTKDNYLRNKLPGSPKPGTVQISSKRPRIKNIKKGV